MKIYYYKRGSGAWVFKGTTAGTESIFFDDRTAIEYLIEKRKAGYEVCRLYLDLAEDFDIIKACFFTPEYWENRTWQEEEDE